MRPGSSSRLGAVAALLGLAAFAVRASVGDAMGPGEVVPVEVACENLLEEPVRADASARIVPYRGWRDSRARGQSGRMVRGHSEVPPFGTLTLPLEPRIPLRPSPAMLIESWCRVDGGPATAYSRESVPVTDLGDFRGLRDGEESLEYLPALFGSHCGRDQRGVVVIQDAGALASLVHETVVTTPESWGIDGPGAPGWDPGRVRFACEAPPDFETHTALVVVLGSTSDRDEFRDREFRWFRVETLVRDAAGIRGTVRRSTRVVSRPGRPSTGSWTSPYAILHLAKTAEPVDIDIPGR
jgi:hypothetical protein